eukprot:2822357-Rhodomonas_salina.1
MPKSPPARGGYVSRAGPYTRGAAAGRGGGACDNCGMQGEKLASVEQLRAGLCVVAQTIETGRS